MKLFFTIVRTFGRSRRIGAGAVALAMLLPISAVAMNSTPKVTFVRTGYAVPLPPISYLDSTRLEAQRAGVQGGYLAAFPAFPWIMLKRAPRRIPIVGAVNEEPEHRNT